MIRNDPQKKKPMLTRWKSFLAFGAMVIGCGIIVLLPAAYKGPQLILIDDRHAMHLMDAVGLVIAIPSWWYLNLLAVRRTKVNRLPARKGDEKDGPGR
jgi:hypothetical protein